MAVERTVIEGIGSRAEILCADVLEGLAELPDESVHCVVSSPPYWGLRDYGTATWEGGDPTCGHKNLASVPMDTMDSHSPEQPARQAAAKPYRAVCGKCGARRVDAQLGLEADPATYVAKMVEVFREVRRVLRMDGCMWLNMGDCYAGSGKGHTTHGTLAGYKQSTNVGSLSGATAFVGNGLKPKDLVGMSWRLTFALQADGWWLRSACPWLKRSAMPESTRDRPTSAVEYMFLLTKDSRYFYDGEAVKVTGSYDSHGGGNAESVAFRKSTIASGGGQSGLAVAYPAGPAGRSRRNSDSFWESWQGLYDEGDGPLAFVVNPVAYKGLHFATFPPRLVEPCIKAGTSERGCCPTCKKPWRRVMEKGLTAHDGQTECAYPKGSTARRLALLRQAARKRGNEYANSGRTLGWRPDCSCYGLTLIPDMPVSPAKKKDESEVAFAARLALYQTRLDHWWQLWRSLKPLYDACVTAPAVCLDPFCGSGTTLAVALQLSRHAIGIELSAPYVTLALDRIKRAVAPATSRSEREEEAPLWQQESG